MHRTRLEAAELRRWSGARNSSLGAESSAGSSPETRNRPPPAANSRSCSPRRPEPAHLPAGRSMDAALASGGCTCRGAAPAALRQPPPKLAGRHARLPRHRPSIRPRPLLPGGPGQHRVSAAQPRQEKDALLASASARTAAWPPPETQFGGRGWTGGSPQTQRRPLAPAGRCSRSPWCPRPPEIPAGRAQALVLPSDS